jgi:hypothetical protein
MNLSNGVTIDTGEIARLQAMQQQIGQLQGENREIAQRIKFLQSGHIGAEVIASKEAWLRQQHQDQQQAAQERFAEQQRQRQAAQQEAEARAKRTAEAIEQRERQNMRDMAAKRQRLIDEGYLVP